jgi:predicted nucleic acid-binding Zn ribbon protein
LKRPSGTKSATFKKRPKLKRPVSAGTVLRRVVEEAGLAPALSRHGLVDKWPELVGPTFARHARADRVSGNTLYVSVDHPVWMNELAALKHVFLEKINAELHPRAPKITDIRFYQRSRANVQHNPADEESDMPEIVPEPSEEDIRFVRQTLAPIRDEGLREVFRGLLEKDRRLKNRRRKKE